jgi:hypothetical protein
MLGEIATGRADTIIYGAHSLWALDLDGRIGPDGKPDAVAREIIRRFNSRTETTISGTGLRVLFLVRDTVAARLRSGGKWSDPDWRCEFKREGATHDGVAIYPDRRFAILTGDIVDGRSLIRAVDEATLAWFQTYARNTFPSGGSGGSTGERLRADRDESRSGRAYRLALAMHHDGEDFDAYRDALDADDDLAAWAQDERQVARTWARAGAEVESPEAWRARIKARFRDERTDEDKRRADLTPRADDDGVLIIGRARFERPGQIKEDSGRIPIVKGFLSEGDFAAIVGKPGCGKSVLAPVLAFAIAEGSPFFGMRTHQGGVIYLAAEDGGGMATRLQALAAKRGSPANLHFVRGLGDLGAKGSADFAALRAAIEHLKPKAVILDTLGAAFRVEDENDAGGMVRVIRACRELTALGTAVVLIAHSPKDETRKTVRGHGSLEGDLDVALFLERTAGGVIEGSFLKNRSGPSDQCSVSFRIEAETFGVDYYGEPRTVPTLVASVADDRPRMSDQEFRVMRAIERRSLFATDVRKATVLDSLVADAAFSDSPDRDNRRTIARRVMRALAGKGIIADDGETVRLITPRGRRINASATPERASEGVSGARIRVVEGSKA